jgi:hypothetical protein
MMALSKAILIAALAVVPCMVGAQTTPSVPQAPIGHRQPRAADVPPGDAAAGAQEAGSTADSLRPTPQQQRDDKVTNGICSDPTC